eukprot:15029043-Ditylum_brightwellii.AAC.1
MQATKQYSCQGGGKNQLLSSHRKCVKSWKCMFVNGGVLDQYMGKKALSGKVEYHVCWYMTLELKGIKMPQKRLRRSDRMVVRRDPGLEDESRYMRQLKREKQKGLIQLTGKT